jgi:hypothetical protein
MIPLRISSKRSAGDRSHDTDHPERPMALALNLRTAERERDGALKLNPFA